MKELDEIYAHLWNAHGDQFALLDQSLGPRGWGFLYDVAAGAGIEADWRVLDVGCGRGNHSLELTRRFECRVTGVDPVAQHAPDFAQASIEALPFAPGAFDFVWCRDMLVHIRDLDRGIQECTRVLQPAGRMLVAHLCTARTGRG